MATRTENLKLSKAETSDAIKSTLTANNQNFDKLDGVITRLKNNQLRGTASGTEIELTDAAEMESVLQLNGNSEQDSRSGKNLFDKSVGVLQYDATKTTFTDDKIEVEITSTSSTYTSSLISIKNSEKLLGKTLTLSGKISSSGTNIGQIRLVATDDIGYLTNNIAYVRPGDESVTITMPDTFPADTTQFGIRVYSNAGSSTAVVGDKVIYTNVQLEEGSIATSYEPYGLQPSPDFPSEIRSVKSKSDNLFDISNKTDNTSFSWASGADYGTTGAVRSDYIPIGDIKALSSNYRFNITFHNANKGYLGNGPELTTSAQEAFYSMAIPNNSNIAYFRVSYRPSPSISGNLTDMTTATDIMLNKGTEALPYQPYGYAPVEVRVEGKNLFDENHAPNSTISGDDLIYINNGSMIISSVFKENTQYTFQAQVKQMQSGTYARMRVDYTDGTSSDILFNEATEYVYKTYTSTANKTIQKVRSYGGNHLYIKRGTFQIEKGTVATPYEPYKLTTVSLPLGNIELRSTPDGTRDTFERVDGVWNKVDYVKAFRYDGSDDEAWGNQSGGADTEVTAMFAMATSLNANYANRISYCNRFKYYTKGSAQNSTDDVEGFNFNPSARYSNYIYFRIKKSLLPTQNIAGWRVWLASNPIEVVFPVKTPTYIPITDQALITALDELEELILHKGYNYITATAVNGVKAQLDLSYYKDINIVLDNINASILSLGGGINV